MADFEEFGAPESPDGAAEQLGGAIGAVDGFAVEKRPRLAWLKSRLTPLVIGTLALTLSGVATVGWASVDYLGVSNATVHAVAAERAVQRESWPTLATTPPSTEGGGETVSRSAVRTSTTSTPRPISVPQTSNAMGRMRIPAIGLSTPIMGNIDVTSLKAGPGWFPFGALPGEVGNFALAGHSVTYTEPFKYLLNLNVGDLVIIEYGGRTFTYQMITAPKDLTVLDSTGGWVTNSPPYSSWDPSKAYITLVTCTVQNARTPYRSVGFGELVSAT